MLSIATKARSHETISFGLRVFVSSWRFASVLMRVAVTGATGFIGRHVVAHLRSRGDDVIEVGRPLQRAAVSKAIAGVETVVHLAGVVSASRDADYSAVNVDATAEVGGGGRGSEGRLAH